VIQKMFIGALGVLHLLVLAGLLAPVAG